MERAISGLAEEAVRRLVRIQNVTKKKSNESGSNRFNTGWAPLPVTRAPPPHTHTHASFLVLVVTFLLAGRQFPASWAYAAVRGSNVAKPSVVTCFASWACGVAAAAAAAVGVACPDSRETSDVPCFVLVVDRKQIRFFFFFVFHVTVRTFVRARSRAYVACWC